MYLTTDFPEVGHMFEKELPHPKYELSRYSTSQLKAWMELTYLFALEHNPKGDDFSQLLLVPDEAAEAYEMSWDCFCTMRDRGVCMAELHQIRASVWHDWVS